MMYHQVMENISNAARSVGRNPAEIKLVAVTKGIAWAQAAVLYSHGQRDFGENRVNEALAKIEEAPKDCHWHFIGTIQSNKVRKVVGRFALIHSVDTLELAQKISQVSNEEGVVTSVLLQANTSGERSKHGLSAEGWKACFEAASALPGIQIEGLMTMAPATDDERIIRKCFASLRALRDELKLRHLSMGMSSDYKLAIEEGATILRIGSALY